MKKIIQLTGLAVAGVFCSCASSAPQEANYQVVPLPQEITMNPSESFVLSNSVKILYPQGNEKMERNARFLADYLKTATGETYSIAEGSEGEKAIVLSLNTTLENPEAYNLTVTANGIAISGATEAGVFYGIQTLRKSLPTIPTSKVKFPAVVINDQPRFAYRGAHFDVARHFYTVEQVKTYIDMMVLHNMNRFHWHLTEDQGWRLEIKKYPKLTEIGSIRKETMIGKNFDKFDGKPYGGFYTQEEAKEIVAYAAERYVTVIPEIDLPGHMQAALAAYPELGCTGGPYEVWTQWGVSPDVLCAGNDKTLEFINDVLSEVIEIFPSEYIHVGGDECPKVRWESCPKCQARIKALGLKSDAHHTKEERLQSFIINHAEKFLNEHNRQIIGWDEILEGGLAPNATVMSWRGEAGGIEAAKQHHDVIMTPNTYLYFDYYQSKDVETEPLAIGGFLPVERVYSYEPMPASLTPEQQAYIKGVQANLWTEYIPTFEHAQYMVLPRWAALSEVQWTKPERKNYEDFLNRLVRLMGIYQQEGYNYAKHVFEIKPAYKHNTAEGNIEVSFSTIDNATIHYTTDGTEVSTSSPVYTSPLILTATTTIKAMADRPGQGSSKIFTESFSFNKATARSVVANESFSPNYTYEGPQTLVDGLKGGKNYKTGHWLGVQGRDIDVTIDLGKETEFSKLSFGTCIVKGDWLFGARGVEVSTSADGTNFSPLASEEYAPLAKEDEDGVKEHTLEFPTTTARYVRVIVRSEKAMPTWHGSKNAPAFLFVDEIQID